VPIVVALLGFVAWKVVSPGSGTVVNDRLSRTVMDERFDRANHWVVGTASHRHSKVAHGVYVLTEKRRGVFESTRNVVNGSFSSVSVAADAKLTPPRPKGFLGVSCVDSIDQRRSYHFIVSPATGAYVLERRHGKAHRLLTSGKRRKVVRTGMNRLEGRCVSDGDGSTELTLTVNGTVVASATDAAGYRDFHGIGVLVGSLEGTTTARFDNALMRTA
jgi:hypothetical protein